MTRAAMDLPSNSDSDSDSDFGTGSVPLTRDPRFNAFDGAKLRKRSDQLVSHTTLLKRVQ